MQRLSNKGTAAAFILNERSNVLHKLPSYESCNVDQIPQKFRTKIQSLRQVRRVKRCKRCFGK